MFRTTVRREVMSRFSIAELQAKARPFNSFYQVAENGTLRRVSNSITASLYARSLEVCRRLSDVGIDANVADDERWFDHVCESDSGG